jgi:hypothetical protein
MLVICLKISVSDPKITNLSDINLVEETFVKKKNWLKTQLYAMYGPTQYNV